jgi:thiamine-phosphate diphosphorylase
MLSPLYFITPDLVEYDETFIEKMKVLISNGLKLFQFRSPSSSVAHHGEILEKLLPVCERYGCKLVYNGSVENALDFGAHGVHLNSARLMTTKEIRVPGHFLTAASCHNLDEISQAVKLDVDFCVLSPVHRSVSHPESRAMGWERFSLMARNLSIPVYALGGIKPHELEIARGNGAHGIAMITGLWDAADPETILNKLM